MSTRSRHCKHRQHTYPLQILTLLENITTPTTVLYSLSNFKILHLNLSGNYCQKVMFFPIKTYLFWSVHGEIYGSEEESMTCWDPGMVHEVRTTRSWNWPAQSCESHAGFSSQTHHRQEFWVGSLTLNSDCLISSKVADSGPPRRLSVPRKSATSTSKGVCAHVCACVWAHVCVFT